MSHLRPLKTIATVLVSNVDKKSVDGERQVRICNYVDVYYNDQITDTLPFMEATATGHQIEQFTLRKGDVLFTKDSETASDIAVPAFVPDSLPGVVCGYHLAIARPNVDLIDGRYLFWALSSQFVRGQFSVAATGVTRFGIRQDEIRGVLIPMHELKVQRSIADYLDSETARIDGLITKKQVLIKKVSDYFISLLESTMASLPNRRRLRQLATLGTGHTPDRKKPEYWQDCQIPWVTAADLSNRTDGYEPLLDTEQKVSEMGVANSSAVVHPAGTVMLCRTASIGLLCEIGVPMATTQAFVTWTPGPDLDSTFLLFALSSMAQEWKRLAFGSTHDTIYMPDLESVKIPYAGLQEQKKIVAQLKDSSIRISSICRKLNEQIEVLREHRQALITAVVTGELKIPEVAA